MNAAKCYRLARWLAVASLCWPATAQAGSPKTQNVFLIISDGFRWQEVFNGAEAGLMTEKEGGVKDPKGLGLEFWRDTPEKL